MSADTAPAAMPSVEDVARAICPFRPDECVHGSGNIGPSGSEFKCYRLHWENYVPAAQCILALFAPVVAEKERHEWPPYRISEPEGGWRSHGSFSPEEKAKLRPVAETLAMLDGNAFFGNEASAGAEWYEQYLPEAYALYEGNGGDSGWAGEASFAKPEASALAAEAALAAAREDAITAYASHIDVAMREYDDNLHHGDDALGPEFFIERGLERAAAAIRAGE